MFKLKPAILIFAMILSTNLIAGTNGMQMIETEEATNQCTAALQPDTYVDKYQVIVETLALSELGTYSSAKSTMSLGDPGEFDGYIKGLFSEVSSATAASLKSTGFTSSGFLAADKILQNEAHLSTDNPLAAYQAKQKTAEFLARNKYDVDDYIKAKKFGTADEAKEADEIYDDLLRSCIAQVSQASTIHLKKSSAERDNRAVLSENLKLMDQIKKDQTNQVTIIPPFVDQSIICSVEQAIGKNKKRSKACDTVNDAIMSDTNGFTQLLSNFSTPNPHGILPIHADKEYCKNCIGEAFIFNASLSQGVSEFTPVTPLGESIADDIHGTRNLFNKVFASKEKIPSKERAKKSWGNIRDTFKEKLTYKLVSKKVNSELAKTTETLQQLYHYKSRTHEDNHEKFDEAFTCYNEDMIDSALHRSCGNDNNRVREAKETLENSFGGFLGEKYGGILRGSFEKAFERLHDLTKHATKSPYNKSKKPFCEEMTREEYAKAQNLRFEENGLKNLSDHFLNISMNPAKLSFDLSNPDHVVHKESLDRLKEKFNAGKVSPIEYMSEVFAYNVSFNPKNLDLLRYLALGKENTSNKNFMQQKDSILAPLSVKENGKSIIPLSAEIKNTDGGINFAVLKKSLSLLMMDQLHKISTTNPNYYAISYNKEVFNQFKKKVDKDISGGKSPALTSVSLEFGDNSSKLESDLARFKTLQKKTCKEFINNISKFSCTPSGELSNFSRKDIDDAIKEMSNENGSKLVDGNTVQQYEQQLVDIALGSLTCEYRALVDQDTPSYQRVNQILPLDTYVSPLAQSDLTARNRARLGVGDNIMAPDYLSDFAESEANCSQKDMVADLYDCAHKIGKKNGKAACEDLGEEATENYQDQQSIVAIAYIEEQIDSNKHRENSAQINLGENTAQLASGQAPRVILSGEVLTDGKEVRITNPDGSPLDNNLLLTWNNNFDKDLLSYRPEVETYEVYQPPSSSGGNLADVIPCISPASSNNSGLPTRPMVTSVSNIQALGLQSVGGISFEDNHDKVLAQMKADMAARYDLNQPGTSSEKEVLAQNTGSANAVSIPPPDNLVTGDKITNDGSRTESVNTEIAPINKIADRELEAVEFSKGDGTVVFDKDLKTNGIINDPGRTPSSYQKIQPKQYSGEQFIADLNADPNTFNETIVDANGNEYVRKMPATQKADFNYLDNNTNALNDEFSNVKNEFNGDAKKISEVEKMEKKYKDLLAKKIEALKTEVDEIKTKTKAPIVQEENQSDNEEIVSIPKESKQEITNPGKNFAENIQNLGTNSGSGRVSTTGTGGASTNRSANNNNNNTFAESNTTGESGLQKRNALGKSNKRKIAASKGRPVSISASAINSGNKTTVSEQLNGYLKLVKSEGGTAIEQSQLIDIEYLEVAGKTEKVPHAVLLDEVGSPLKVPLDEEHVDPKVIEKVLKAYKKIVKNAQDEHERILEQEVFLESLKKEIAMIQAQASADLEKIRNDN